MTSRLTSGTILNTDRTWSSISRCCPVTQITGMSLDEYRCRKAAIRGASLIASGRVPKTKRTVFFEFSEDRCLLVPVGDSSLGEVIGRHFQGHTVTCEYSDTIPA